MDYLEELEKELKQIEKLIEISKQNNYSKSILFILNALYIKRKESFNKIVK